MFLSIFCSWVDLLSVLSVFLDEKSVEGVVANKNEPHSVITNTENGFELSNNEQPESEPGL